MNERVSFGEMPVGIGLVPHAVEPDAADGAVVGEEFGELAVHVGVDVRVEVAVIGAAVVPGGATAREIVRVMPIELRIVEVKLDALAVSFVGEHFERIFFVGRALDDVPVREFGVEHGEAVVVAGSDGDVLHAGGFGESDPGFGVEFFGIEKVREALVVVELELAVVEDPFAVTEDAVDAPVDEEAEFVVLEVLAGF